MLVKIMKAQDKTAWTFRKAAGVWQEEVVDTIAFFQGLRDELERGEYVPKVDTDEGDNWIEEAMLCKGPFEEELWYGQCMAKTNQSKSTMDLYELEPKSQSTTEHRASTAGRPPPADLLMSFEEGESNPGIYRLIGEVQEKKGLDIPDAVSEVRGENWSKTEILEKRVERIELDRLKDASDYAPIDELEHMKSELEQLTSLINSQNSQIEMLSKFRLAITSSVSENEEELEATAKRLAKVEEELESLRRAPSVSAASPCTHGNGPLNERLLKRIPKFIGEAAAFPAFKQRFLAYKDQVKSQPSFVYYDDLCTKLEGEALDQVKDFAAQVENSFEVAMERLTRFYGEFEPEEQLYLKISEVGSLEELQEV